MKVIRSVNLNCRDSIWNICNNINYNQTLVLKNYIYGGGILFVYRQNRNNYLVKMNKSERYFDINKLVNVICMFVNYFGSDNENLHLLLVEE